MSLSTQDLYNDKHLIWWAVALCVSDLRVTRLHMREILLEPFLVARQLGVYDVIVFILWLL